VAPVLASDAESSNNDADACIARAPRRPGFEEE
jgi:hypothetical protein